MIQVDASELDKLSQQLGQAAQAVPEEQEKALLWLGTEFVGIMRKVLEETKWQGTLQQSVRVLESSEEQVIIGPDEAVAPHAKYHYKGTGPHTPPFSKILAWTMSKLGGEMRDAWGVWWSIRHHGTSVWVQQRYGTKGFPFPEETLKTGEAKTALRKVAVRLGKAIVAEIAGGEE